tara:strand:- start:1313 stop:1891 length:579 start_codon:yes stop_codon:yes gene_type:complete
MSENTEVADTEENTQPETTDQETTETVDLESEVEKWKTLSKKNEQMARANKDAAKELDALRKSQLSDTERLIESTKDETRLAVRMEFAEKLVDAELKSNLIGRVLEGNALLDFNKSKFLDDDGNVDSDAIQAWVDENSTKTDAPKPDLGQGARGSQTSLAQIRSRDELTNMSRDDILSARKDGRLDSLMGKN